MNQDAPTEEVYHNQPPGQRGRAILRGGIWLWGQEAGEMLLAFVFTWVTLRQLGPDGFGTIVLTQSILNMAGLGNLHLELALMRFVPDFRGRQQWQAARLTFRLVVAAKLLLALLVAGLLYWLAPWISRLYPHENLTTAIQVGTLSMFSTALVNVGKALTLGLLHPEVRTVLSLARRILEIVGLLVGAAIGLTVVRAVAVLAFADTFAAFAFMLVSVYYLRQDPAGEQAVTVPVLTRRIVNYCLPMMGSQLTAIAGQNSDKLLLGGLTSPVILGLYSVARLAADRLELFMTQLPLMAVPVIAEEPGTSGRSKQVHNLIERLLHYQWGLGALGNLAIWSMAPLFILVVGGREFTQAVPVLRILGFAILFWAGTASLHVFFLAFEKTMGILILSLTQLVTVSLLYLVLVPGWEAVGAAAADSLSQAVTLVLALWLVRRWFAFSSWRLAGSLLKQLALVTVLIIPVALLHAYNGPWLAAWSVGALFLFGSYLLRAGVPGEAELARIQESDWGNPSLNQAKLRLCSGLLRYQFYLKKAW